jgi:hypothetical protein
MLVAQYADLLISYVALLSDFASCGDGESMNIRD